MIGQLPRFSVQVQCSSRTPAVEVLTESRNRPRYSLASAAVGSGNSSKKDPPPAYPTSKGESPRSDKNVRGVTSVSIETHKLRSAKVELSLVADTNRSIPRN